VQDPTTGAPTLDSAQTRETLQMYADILPYGIEGATAWERDQMKDLFNDQKLGMYVNGPWGKGQTDCEPSDDDPQQTVIGEQSLLNPPCLTANRCRHHLADRPFPPLDSGC
jgi:hypothetical protein